MSQQNLSVGAVVKVRDEEWLVTGVRNTSEGELLEVTGISELVKDTTACFYTDLDAVESLDPRAATLRPDASPRYREARLWLESMIRRTPVPVTEPSLVASDAALADPLAYQRSAVSAAIDPDNLRTRILLADAVGLGKTLEIGMILSELIRRGRGERILIVCPKHVLEQTQHEMWCRFDIPFVRLDSVGVQRIRQTLPADRNPFTYYKRVIVSMDTLKQARFTRDLRQHHWDAVVIDESHNVTGASTQNNALANTLAPTTDSLILASATPHNGRRESFAELVRLLEPTAVSPDGTLNDDDVARLVKRRHRNSPEVASVVGADWAERMPIDNRLVTASDAEDALAAELEATWLHPTGASPYSGSTSHLFGWTLAKGFLSSPQALAATIANRRRQLDPAVAEQARELTALDRLRALNEATFEQSSKFNALVTHLRDIGVARNSSTRAVVFSERVDTVAWLADRLPGELNLSGNQVAVLHGGMSDVEQLRVVDSFKQSSSPIRVLVTSDIASEGVNLHMQCHQLVHYDIPWSLIRIEQRNGRIDRYGQRVSPQITTLLLHPSSQQFRGDLRVLTRLVQREEEVHLSLGDAASLMGSYSVKKEEDEIVKVLAGRKSFDEAVPSPSELSADDNVAAFLDALTSTAPVEAPQTPVPIPDPLYAHDIDFLRDAVTTLYEDPVAPPTAEGHGGIGWRDHPEHSLVEFQPPADLRRRLEVLPESYLRDREVLTRLRLAVSPDEAERQRQAALADPSSTSSWPEAHFLGPLHPVLDWAADRCLARLSRNSIYVIRGQVDNPTVLVMGTLTNHRGQVVAACWGSVEFPGGNPAIALTLLHESSAEMLTAVGLDQQTANPGPVTELTALQPLVPAAVKAVENRVPATIEAASRNISERVEAWNQRTVAWQADAETLPQISSTRARRTSVTREAELIDQMRPSHSLVRPLLLVVPAEHAER